MSPFPGRETIEAPGVGKYAASEGRWESNCGTAASGPIRQPNRPESRRWKIFSTDCRWSRVRSRFCDGRSARTSQRRHDDRCDNQVLLIIPGLERKLLDPDIANESATSKKCIAQNRYGRDLHCAGIEGRGNHDDNSVERRRGDRQGTNSRGRGLAGLHHRTRWYPLPPLRVRPAAVLQPRTALSRVI
jgi:hypothetical protein